ncbi:MULTISPECIES: magnesium transporter [unclassified Lentimicrobium]|uniref:magnesium transporter n=1 Tax=unclassified Lentimicrobium TaxID=2677434 RepID=UPI001552136E|nr:MULTISPECIES: magnesium transporter [unclassified Lentimicrobium]NPD47000.1 magnesium transporter [Lentimicrobium sp. S6]NPD83907.1 magnesium transporter [Lentimicrobium sp. L6]
MGENNTYEQFELTREFIEELQQNIEFEQKDQIIAMLEDLHPADIAEIYEELNIDEAKFTFLLHEQEVAADVLAELEEDDRKKFLKAFPASILAKRFIENMDSDDAADLIQELPEEKQERVLYHMKDEEQIEDIKELLSYDEDSAGGLMAKELFLVNQESTVRQCLVELRKQAEEVHDVYYIYVVDDANILIGTLSLKSLLIASAQTKAKDICNTDIISAQLDEKSEEVALMMQKYDLVALPVVNKTGELMGRITIDDVVDVIKEEAEKDYQMISGLTDDVESSDSVYRLTRARFPWLLIGLFGGIIGAGVIGHFEGDIAKYAGLALFLPLIAAMGGNAGVQSSSIIVQGIASGDMGIDSIAKKLVKELAVSFVNGIILSMLIFTYSYFFHDSFPLTISVSIALFIVIIFASLFGTLVPMLLNKFEIDPALATGPFITTVNDIMGLLIYLYIARMVFLVWV